MVKSITILLFLFSCQLFSQNKPIVVDHNCIREFEVISGNEISYAAALKILFRHASVGGTINDGLDCLQGTRSSPAECTEYPEYKYDRRNWDFQPRGNSGWYGKVDEFVEAVYSQLDDFDIFSFKYCYLDGIDGLLEPCGKDNDTSKINRAWNYLKENMEMLEKNYPEKLFVWWTIPLTQTGQLCTEELNTLIRNYVRDNNKILFDIADIECYDPEGNHTTNENGWEKAYKGYCGEQKPDAQACHPNWTGKLLLAKAFWWMMKEIANQRLTDIYGYFNSSDTYISPNPVITSTTFNYTVNRPEQVTIKVFDALGNRLKTLVNNLQNQGTHEAVFRADEFSQGLYYYTVQIGNKVGSGLLIVVK